MGLKRRTSPLQRLSGLTKLGIVVIKKLASVKRAFTEHLPCTRSADPRGPSCPGAGWPLQTCGSQRTLLSPSSTHAGSTGRSVNYHLFMDAISSFWNAPSPCSLSGGLTLFKTKHGLHLVHEVTLLPWRSHCSVFVPFFNWGVVDLQY